MAGSGTPRQKILIVDDTPANITTIGQELKADYKVFIATSGEAALEKAIADPPDLILLDIMMPGMDGYEVCRQLKARQETRSIPVIFITAKNTEKEETRGLEIGAVDYITKPFRLSIVRARVKTHLELKRKSDILESLSSRDGLTGIYNRRQFDAVFAAEWKRAIRSGRHLTVLLLDIDRFKRYNDHYGHLSGDDCLKRLADALSGTVKRAADFLARYGGEEFVVVLPETDAKSAMQMAEKVRRTVADLQMAHAHATAAPYITVSVGGATTVPTTGIDPLLLLEAADNAMYEAKNAGGNQSRHRQI